MAHIPSIPPSERAACTIFHLLINPAKGGMPISASAEAVKHAAGRTATTPPMETESGTLSIITVESD